MSSIAQQAAATIQTSPESVSAVPPWFGEVAVVAHFLGQKGKLVALQRGRSGQGVFQLREQSCFGRCRQQQQPPCLFMGA